MLNLANKKQKNSFIKKLTIDDIKKFYNGNKNDLIGLEYERLSLDKKTLRNANYEKLAKIIEHFCKITSWNLIYDNKTIIGALSDNGSSLSLEPGCQLEISLAPKKDILPIETELEKIINLLDKIANAYNVIFLGYGISPVSNVEEISLLQKSRYEIMDNYLPTCNYGELCPKMMRQSAGIQINIDYKNEKDAYLKLKLLNLIMPFTMGLCANSPFENNKLTYKQSIRAHAWRYTGKNRCNLFYKNIFKGFLQHRNLIKNYINEVLNVPMVFIERNKEIIPIKGKISFKEFLKDKFSGYFASLDDYILHQSLCFPDIRLKKYIEIRNHDSSNPKMALALCAFYKGLMKCNIEQLLSKFSYLKIEDIDKHNIEIIEKGLNYKVYKKIDGWDIIVELFGLARKNLTASERMYLEPILNILKFKKTQADLIIDAEIKSAKELIELIY